MAKTKIKEPRYGMLFDDAHRKGGEEFGAEWYYANQQVTQEMQKVGFDYGGIREYPLKAIISIVIYFTLKYVESKKGNT